MYCKKCGGKIESYASNCPFCGEPVPANSVQATYSGTNEGTVTSRGVGKWILTFILMSITPVNLIMLFVWAFGGGSKKDPTFRSWARAQLILVLIGVILVILFMALLMPVIMSAIAELEGSAV
jgi:uncharacterized membrane protein YvbJ